LSVIRLAAGHISEATITGSSSYLITNFTPASDQVNWAWLEPEYIPMHRLRSAEALDSSLNDDGYFESYLRFNRLTQGQVAYIDTNHLTSGSWGRNTVYMPKRGGTLSAFQVYMHKFKEDAIRIDRMGIAVDKDVYYDVVYALKRGVEV
jgi:hypothetical protein